MPRLDDFASEALSGFEDLLFHQLEQSKIPGLDGEPLQAPLAQLLGGLDDSEAWSGVSRPEFRKACLSGLWLLAGELDQSHALSQSLETAEGSFWHAIMHRREGDFANAKYWFHRVGPHPVIDRLRQLEPTGYRSATEFVDRCAQALAVNRDAITDCQRIQWLEWQLLMTHCLQHA